MISVRFGSTDWLTDRQTARPPACSPARRSPCCLGSLNLSCLPWPQRYALKKWPLDETVNERTERTSERSGGPSRAEPNASPSTSLAIDRWRALRQELSSCRDFVLSSRTREVIKKTQSNPKRNEITHRPHKTRIRATKIPVEPYLSSLFFLSTSPPSLNPHYDHYFQTIFGVKCETCEKKSEKVITIYMYI